MKRLVPAALAATLLALAATPAAAAPGGVGSRLKNVEQIEDFSQTGAESWSDLQGRALLIEFFAYW